METTRVAELKQNLSHYLHAVEAGGEVIVTSHRRTVARLVPNASGGGAHPSANALGFLVEGN